MTTAATKVRILILEDELAIARIWQRVLGPVADITHFASAEKAIATLSLGDSDFDLVLCDHNLEDKLTGKDFLTWVEANRPRWRENFISTTGNALAEKLYDRRVEKNDLKGIVALATRKGA